MPPNKSNDKSAYKSKLMLDLEKLINGEVQNVKVDLTKVSIIKLAQIIGVLSEDVKTYMYLFNSKRYYALNDRTINLLMKGTIGMSATTSETAEVISTSDKEVVEFISNKTEAELFLVDKNETSRWIIFPYLKITIFDLSKYDMF